MVENLTEYLDGWNAHKNGYAPENNPYSEALQAISYRRWLSGWCGRFEAVKRGHTPKLDGLYD